MKIVKFVLLQQPQVKLILFFAWWHGQFYATIGIGMTPNQTILYRHLSVLWLDRRSKKANLERDNKGMSKTVNNIIISD